MGNLKIMYLGNGGTRYTDVTYAAAGVNDDGDVINEQKFKDFWHRVNIALKKKYEKENNNADRG